METDVILLIALGILAYGLFSARLQASALTAPMVFTALGLAFSPHLWSSEQAFLHSHLLKLLAELTLIVVLFSDASRIHLNTLRRGYLIPLRMLSIGLPLCFLFGWAAALGLLPGFGLWEAAVIAAMLAPTDAALSQAVVSDPRVPVRIRQGLNVESGLNDGLSLPLVIFTLVCASAAEEHQAPAGWLAYGAEQLLLGPALGAAVAWLGGRALKYAARRELAAQSFQDLGLLSLGFISYGLAQWAGGNGLMAAFVAGLVVGNTARELCDSLYEFAEAEGQLLVLLTFFAFGALMAWPALEQAGAMTLVYAVASLTILRMLPVALSLIGLELQAATLLFLGWFGPRGVASVLFSLLLLEEYRLDGSAGILAVVTTTVLISIYAHGLSASPLARAYAGFMQGHPPDRHEHRGAVELPVRLPFKSHQRRRKNK